MNGKKAKFLRKISHYIVRGKEPEYGHKGRTTYHTAKSPKARYRAIKKAYTRALSQS